jgi:hypothetical protein
VSAVEPIEIAVPSPMRAPSAVEVAIGDAVIRCEPGVDVAYVAALIRALSSR